MVGGGCRVRVLPKDVQVEVGEGGVGGRRWRSSGGRVRMFRLAFGSPDSLVVVASLRSLRSWVRFAFVKDL